MYAHLRNVISTTCIAK